ncbi:ubiquinone biosynthesis protein COQ7-domain-containing protein [Tricladium varicosporioides]|nr:ubiquinone biosynthesis protein COQ7-domain-containing protein [Hymenoscyphus varicosporioides]
MALYSSTRSAALAAHLPVYDFLAPSLVHLPRATRSIRHFSAKSRQLAATTPQDAQKSSPDELFRTPKSGPQVAANPSPSSKPLTQAQRDFLTSALRVNQAGELAATLIYTAQTPPIVSAHPHLRPLMKHMYDQEAGHFNTFNGLLAKHRIRPTAMYPIWSLAATALGWSTAVMGREAAMACTEAVETEIGEHYNGQVRTLLEMIENMEKTGEEVGEDLKELVDTIRRIRDEELEHLDYAVENDAQKAVPHELLTGVIRAGCRGAIWISERV